MAPGSPSPDAASAACWAPSRHRRTVPDLGIGQRRPAETEHRPFRPRPAPPPAQHPGDPRRRPRLRRPSALRLAQHQDAQPRQARRVRRPLHPGLLRAAVCSPTRVALYTGRHPGRIPGGPGADRRAARRTASRPSTRPWPRCSRRGLRHAHGGQVARRLPAVVLAPEVRVGHVLRQLLGRPRLLQQVRRQRLRPLRRGGRRSRTRATTPTSSPRRPSR